MQTYNTQTKKESFLRLSPIRSKPYCYKVELVLPMQTHHIGTIDTGGDGGTFFTKRKHEHTSN